MTKKVLLLADSCSLPRSFPKAHATDYEETYPFLLQSSFPEMHLCTITIGGATSTDLIGQGITYFDSWKPEVIIVQAGIVDCRPEPVPQFIRLLLTEFEFLHRLKAFVFKPNVMKWLVKFWGSDRTSLQKFQRNIKKLKSIFPESKVFWLEIATTQNGGYESHRPGILKRMEEFNRLISKNLGDGFVPIHQAANAVQGVNEDHIHLNKRGHAVVHEILKEKIKAIDSGA